MTAGAGASGDLGVLLAPGAGADRDQAALVALDEVLSAAGAEVVRMDFPYRRAGRRAPDRPGVLMGALLSEAEALARRCGRLVMGGRSMGGRIASMVAAGQAGSAPATAGLALISYPLHPPGRPEKLRTEHFPAVPCPCLFVSGTRDAFATPAELERATAAIPEPVTHRWIEGKDHGMRGADAAVAQVVAEWVSRL